MNISRYWIWALGWRVYCAAHKNMFSEDLKATSLKDLWTCEDVLYHVFRVQRIIRICRSDLTSAELYLLSPLSALSDLLPTSGILDLLQIYPRDGHGLPHTHSTRSEGCCAVTC